MDNRGKAQRYPLTRNLMCNSDSPLSTAQPSEDVPSTKTVYNREQGINHALPSDKSVDDPESLISTLASTCTSSFNSTIQVLSKEEDKKYEIIFRKFEKRFSNWAAYLGVFAEGKGSLDHRLERHRQYRDLILLLLNMLNVNINQTITEPSEPSSDETSDDEVDRRKIEAESIQKSINELDRLAIHIRQSSTSSLDTRVKAFEARKPSEVSSYEARAIIAVNGLYPDAPDSLRRYLSKWMTHRYMKLLYWQSHDKKLRTDSRKIRQQEENVTQLPLQPSPSIAKASSLPQRPIQDEEPVPPKTSGSKVSAGTSFLSGTRASELGPQFITPTAETKMPARERAVASTVLETGAKFPGPPNFEDGEDQKPCPLCRKLFLKDDFIDSRWWRSHVNDDLMPFLCVSRTCMESPSFSSRTAWKRHIGQDHDGTWFHRLKMDSQDISDVAHGKDVCPLCCLPLAELIAFKTSNSKAPKSDLSLLNERAISDSKTASKTVRFDVAEPEVPFTVDTESPIRAESAIILDHIADHLQFLALLTPRLSNEKLEGGEKTTFPSERGLSSGEDVEERSTLADHPPSAEVDETQVTAVDTDFGKVRGKEIYTYQGWQQAKDRESGEAIDWSMVTNMHTNKEEGKKIEHMRNPSCAQFAPTKSSMMAECSYPDDKTSETGLQNWLRKQFNDGNIVAQSRNVPSVFNPLSTEPLDEFRQHVREHLATGVNGEGEEVEFVPPSALTNYWTREKVDIILGYEQFNSEMIVTSFSQVFSILVYIGEPYEISWFCKHRQYLDDVQLPFYEPSFPGACRWMNSFLTAQWMFIPLILTGDKIFNQVLPPQTILPVKYVKPLTKQRAGEDTATLWEVRVHPEANKVTSESQPVVFKIFEGSDAEKLFNDETNVHLKLRIRHSNYITRHFGSFSFEQKHKCIIVLEYTAGGSLQDFLRETDIPVTPDDIRFLWSRLLKLLDGLHVLHDLDRPDGAVDRFLAGILQDIQPANILVFPQDNGRSRFDVKFKLTDFGLTEIGRVSRGKMATVNRGNRMYAAPESFANLQVQHLVKTNVPPVADIWALGAVFSDVLIWSIGGETYREQYRLRRQEEIASQLHLKERGIDACFHNMHDRLKAVDESHRLALDKRPRYDDVSPGLSEIILSFMLVDHEERLQAIHIRSRANKMLRSIQRSPADRDGFLSVGDSIEGSTKDHGTIPVLHQPSPNDRAEMPPVERQDATHQDPAFDESPTTSFPQIQLPAKATEQLIWSERVVTVEEVYALMESPGRTRSRLASLVPRLDKSSFIMSLPGMEIARRRICADIGRDQIMIIDDYSSMRQHMVQVKMAARVISYVAKTADYNGMEVYTASEAAKKPRICITSSQIEKEIGKMKTIEGKCDMGACLNHILDKILIDGKKVKPTSIYIYTDGAWEPRTNVEQPIYRAINHLIQNGQSTSTLMLQFVQFGHDEKGTKHLRFLDDECTKQVGSEIYDIVDTRHCDDPVPKIVLGSISASNDWE